MSDKNDLQLYETQKKNIINTFNKGGKKMMSIFITLYISNKDHNLITQDHI